MYTSINHSLYLSIQTSVFQWPTSKNDIPCVFSGDLQIFFCPFLALCTGGVVLIFFVYLFTYLFVSRCVSIHVFSS